jgi:hypothetical protein
MVFSFLHYLSMPVYILQNPTIVVVDAAPYIICHRFSRITKLSQQVFPSPGLYGAKKG